MIRRFVIATAFALLAMGTAATAGTSDKPVSWQFDIGYSMVQGMAGDVFEDGYTLGFGAVLRPNPKTPIGYRFEMTYDFWDVDTSAAFPSGTLVDDGDANQWAIRAGVQYESSGDKAKFVGGVGIGGYRLHANLSETVYVPGYVCDPYYWWYCYPGLVPGDIILADKTLTKFGYYANLGVVFPLENSDFFIEGQYHWVNVEEYFETFPIVLGWRF